MRRAAVEIPWDVVAAVALRLEERDRVGDPRREEHRPRRHAEGG